MHKENICSVFDIKIEEPLKKKVIELISTLETLKKNIESVHCTKDEKLFFSRMWDMWDFFNSYNDEKAYEVFSHTKEFAEYNKFFKEQNGYFERALDSAESLNIIAQNPEHDILDLLDHTFSKKVFLQTADEIKEIDTKKVKTLVMIGCGPMPETVIHIAENTDIEKIIGVDIDAEAVFMAGRVIHKLGLDDRVVLNNLAGELFDFSEADCIHMANFVRGKKEVLEQISKTAKDGCTIITRKTRLLSNLAYEEIYPKIHPRLVVTKEVKGIFYNFFVFEKFYFPVNNA